MCERERECREGERMFVFLQHIKPTTKPHRENNSEEPYKSIYVYILTGRGSYGAYGVHLSGDLGHALVAGRLARQDGHRLRQEARRARVHEWDRGGEAHSSMGGERREEGSGFVG